MSYIHVLFQWHMFNKHLLSAEYVPDIILCLGILKWKGMSFGYKENSV